jgi:hypothetical protein
MELNYRQGQDKFHTRRVTVNNDPSSKRQAANPPSTGRTDPSDKHDGLVVCRSGNMLLKHIEERAIDAIMKRRKDEPPSAASINILSTIWATELCIEMCAQIVHDVREDVKAHYHGCSVCYMVVGKEVQGHISGSGCQTLPFDDSTEGWPDFKANLRFPHGLYCFLCLLPSVRTTRSKMKSTDL